MFYSTTPPPICSSFYVASKLYNLTNIWCLNRYLLNHLLWNVCGMSIRVLAKLIEKTYSVTCNDSYKIRVLYVCYIKGKILCILILARIFSIWNVWSVVLWHKTEVFFTGIFLFNNCSPFTFCYSIYICCVMLPEGEWKFHKI